MFFATEEVNAAQVAIGNLRERTEHRVDDGGLVAARGAVAANTDLRETNAARFLQNVADISKRTIERVVYVCSLELDPSRGTELLERIRRYWD